jgi:Lon protease-like protein
VDINDELQIRCRARICAFRMGRSPYRHTQISVEFIDLEEETRAALARFLRETQPGNIYAQPDNSRYTNSYAA